MLPLNLGFWDIRFGTLFIRTHLPYA